MTCYCRYVCDNMNHASKLFDTFNQAHPNIDFTTRYENDNKFNFLNLSIRQRCDGTPEKTIHRKDMWIVQCLHYNSFCLVSYKPCLRSTLFTRIKALCS
ncbi:unnamed protein product [Heterobilharzia americana]|nr:unnamed protein product [Heterobilharzia americana]